MTDGNRAITGENRWLFLTRYLLLMLPFRATGGYRAVPVEAEPG